MANKNMLGRVQLKNDTAAHWDTAGKNEFKPLRGEMIIYQSTSSDTESPTDYARFKIGDGKTDVNNLPFFMEGVNSRYDSDTDTVEIF